MVNDTDQKMAAVIVGTSGETYGWANSVLEHDGKAALYCAPKRLGIRYEQYLSILKNYIAAHPEAGSAPVEIMPYELLLSLQEVFPCN
jgi:hypothetical protein